MYMGLLTDSYISQDTEAFTYYSRNFVQHLYWNMVRVPDKKNGISFIFEDKDLDARLKQTDFHIETPANRQAFRAFIEFIQRESQIEGVLKNINKTQKDEGDQL